VVAATIVFIAQFVTETNNKTAYKVKMIIKTVNSKIIVLLFSIILLFCQITISAASDNLLLDRNHGGDGSAWGNEHCDSCHLINFIHDNTSTKLRNLVREKSYHSCAGCHGNNGTALHRKCIICHNQNDLDYASEQKGDNSHNFKSPDKKNFRLGDEECLDCHNASNMDGEFEFNIDLTRFDNQYGHPSDYKTGSDFCLACHNRDHQQNGFEMSTDNYRDPLIAMEDNYHFIDKHGIGKGSGQRTYSGLRKKYNYPAVISCTDCHAMHGTHNDKLIIGNAFNGASRLSKQIKEQHIIIDAPNGEYAQLCVVCHAMEQIIEEGDIDTGNGLSGVHQAAGSCQDCHRHGMAVQTGL